ncbi:MAG: hypothetical protein QOH57_1691 [Mycobacterium sp.]|jgi:hypothetical protein|nr:hypothetical protein [Mycobacterium sp.]
MRGWLVGILSVTALLAALLSPTVPRASAGDTPIGRVGDTLRVTNGSIVADVTVVNVLPSDVPPGFGYPPRWPRQEVWRAQITVTAISSPAPFSMGPKFTFRGVTQTGDAYAARNTDAPDALQYALLNAPKGATVSGGVYWDVYRDLVSNVVLMDPKTGYRLAQWNL